MTDDLLRFKSDWGGANLTRVCGWLAQWVWDHTPGNRLSVIHTGRGMGDNLRALAAGEVDVALMTPASFAALARAGTGPFEGTPMPHLRAIAQLPHRDAMLVASRTDLVDLAELSDLGQLAGVRLAMGADDRDGLMGFGARVVLRAAGLTPAGIAGHGTVRRHELPFGCLADLRDGRADVIITEAIMTPDWLNLGGAHPLRYASLSTEHEKAIADTWGLSCIEIPAGYLPGMREPVRTLDYSDWLIATTTDLPDETAGLLADALVRGSAGLELQYAHLPVERSPLTYPIHLDTATRTDIPLHPGAARVYDRATGG